MSDPNIIAARSAAAPAPVRAAIAQAAAKTGVDFDYLFAQARLESSLDPNARASTSSAAGLYQFTKGTWAETLRRHGDEHGLGWAQAALADPALRSQAMALRHDPQAAALMAAELASDNREALSGVLGRTPDASELYLAHFLGAGGAQKFLTALAADPEQSAAAILPAPAQANRTIFYTSGGAPRSLGAVMALLRGKVEQAMGAAQSPSSSGEGLGWGVSINSALSDIPHPPTPSPQGEGAQVPPLQGGPVAREFAAQAAALPPRPSMAQTLVDTFGLAGNAAEAPRFVRAAYGKLQAFGL